MGFEYKAIGEFDVCIGKSGGMSGKLSKSRISKKKGSNERSKGRKEDAQYKM